MAIQDPKALTGTCKKHGEFILIEGCHWCIAESLARNKKTVESINDSKPDPPVSLVKVKYWSDTKGEASGRAYTYFTTEPLGVGELVEVPVGEPPTDKKAVVTEINVPESENEAFRDRVKYIKFRLCREVFKPDASPSMDMTQEVPLTIEPDDPIESELKPMADPLKSVQTEVTEVNLYEQTRPAQVAEVPGKTAVISIYPDSDAIALFREGQKLLGYAEARVIITNDDLKPATDDLVIILQTRNALEKKRLEMGSPIRAYLDKVNEGFKRMLEPFDQANKLNKKWILEFEEANRKDAAAALKLEADKLDVAQREAVINGTGEHTQELGTVEPPPPVPEIIRTNMGSTSGRVTWKYEVTDFALLSDEHKLENGKTLSAYAKSHKDTRPLPGVRFYYDRGLTVRSK